MAGRTLALVGPGIYPTDDRCDLRGFSVEPHELVGDVEQTQPALDEFTDQSASHLGPLRERRCQLVEFSALGLQRPHVDLFVRGTVAALLHGAGQDAKTQE
jgi:hypothetical protein